MARTDEDNEPLTRLPRAMVLALALAAAFQLGSRAFHQLIGLLINILIAFFLGLAIEPAVSRTAARGMRRGLATCLVFLGLTIAVAGFVSRCRWFRGRGRPVPPLSWPDCLLQYVSTAHTPVLATAAA